MARRFSPLSARQSEILRWIGDGCPEGIIAGFGYKATALTLQDRRLVVVSKRRGVWRAGLTDGGRYYLDHGTYLQAPSSNGSTKCSGPPTSDTTAARTRASDSSGAAPARAGHLSPTEQLIVELLEHGEVEVAAEDRRRYRSCVSAAIRFGKVPAGKRLIIDGTSWSSRFTIRLEAAPPWLHTALEPIAVSATLRRSHPVVAAMLAAEQPSRLSAKNRSRAIRLAHALATAAEQRRYTAVARTSFDTNDREHRRAHLIITVAGHRTGIRFRQLFDHVPHSPTAAELARARTDTWYRIPRHDPIPTDRLRIELTGRFEHRQSLWSDTSSRPLERCLPEILQEIELRAAAATSAREAEAAAAEERRRRWQRALNAARRDHVEARRADHLLHQSETWHQTRRLVAYLEAMDHHINTITDPETAAAAREWHQWATDWSHAADPLANTIAMPTIPEPTPGELTPHLHGWSPYSPDHTVFR